MKPRKPIIQRADGYRLVWMPEHPAAHRGYVYEHRLVAEKKVGRRLERTDIVHHVNEDPSDNRPENLEILTKAEHQRLHMSSGPTDEEGKALILAGVTTRQLARIGLWQRRAARLRRELRQAGSL